MNELPCNGCGRSAEPEDLRTCPSCREVLCDECDSALKLDELDDTIRKEVLLTIGAR